MNDLAPTPLPPSPSRSSAVQALQLELAKCLQLVVPASMTADDRAAWIAAAADALDGIRPLEISAVSAELRRTVTRPSQIVPEIARLVAEARKRRAPPVSPAANAAAAEFRINREAGERMGRAKNQREVEEAWRWERQQRAAAGLPVPPIAAPLSRDELDHLPADIEALGLKLGFLERRNGALYETTGTH